MNLSNKLWLMWGICFALAIAGWALDAPVMMWTNTGLSAAAGWAAFLLR